MRLKAFGSFQNAMADCYDPATFPEWKVGDGITQCLWSDRHAGTVVRISASGKRLWFQRDRVTKWQDGGEYALEYEPDPMATVEMASLTKRGWKVGGSRGTPVMPGRQERYDRSF